jgi:hypothetical protein
MGTSQKALGTKDPKVGGTTEPRKGRKEAITFLGARWKILGLHENHGNGESREVTTLVQLSRDLTPRRANST